MVLPYITYLVVSSAMTGLLVRADTYCQWECGVSTPLFQPLWDCMQLGFGYGSHLIRRSSQLSVCRRICLRRRCVKSIHHLATPQYLSFSYDIYRTCLSPLHLPILHLLHTPYSKRQTAHAICAVHLPLVAVATNDVNIQNLVLIPNIGIATQCFERSHQGSLPLVVLRPQLACLNSDLRLRPLATFGRK